MLIGKLAHVTTRIDIDNQSNQSQIHKYSLALPTENTGRPKLPSQTSLISLLFTFDHSRIFIFWQLKRRLPLIRKKMWKRAIFYGLAVPWIHSHTHIPQTSLIVRRRLGMKFVLFYVARYFRIKTNWNTAGQFHFAYCCAAFVILSDFRQKKKSARQFVRKIRTIFLLCIKSANVTRTSELTRRHQGSMKHVFPSENHVT